MALDHDDATMRQRERPKALEVWTVDDEVFDTEEVAGYIKIPAKTLEQWRYLGKGPAYIKVGKHVRYRASAVNAWLDSQSKTPAA